MMSKVSSSSIFPSQSRSTTAFRLYEQSLPMYIIHQLVQVLRLQIVVFHISSLVSELRKDILADDVIASLQRRKRGGLLPLICSQGSQLRDLYLVDLVEDVIARIFGDVEHLLD
jgi:hypothetical protein